MGPGPAGRGAGDGSRGRGPAGAVEGGPALLTTGREKVRPRGRPRAARLDPAGAGGPRPVRRAIAAPPGEPAAEATEAPAPGRRRGPRRRRLRPALRRRG